MTKFKEELKVKKVYIALCLTVLLVGCQNNNSSKSLSSASDYNELIASLQKNADLTSYKIESGSKGTQINVYCENGQWKLLENENEGENYTSSADVLYDEEGNISKKYSSKNSNTFIFIRDGIKRYFSESFETGTYNIGEEPEEYSSYQAEKIDPKENSFKKFKEDFEKHSENFTFTKAEKEDNTVYIISDQNLEEANKQYIKAEEDFKKKYLETYGQEVYDRLYGKGICSYENRKLLKREYVFYVNDKGYIIYQENHFSYDYGNNLITDTTSIYRYSQFNEIEEIDFSIYDKWLETHDDTEKLMK